MKRLLPILLLTLCLTCTALAETFPPTSTPTIPGIDVSAWQRIIDWQSVYASGVRIAMIRASEGNAFVDPYFARNAAGASAAGIAAGYYHFMTATTAEEAAAQADFFVSVIAGKSPECLLALDFGGGGSLSDAALTELAEVFLSRVEARTGLGVMLYTDAWAAKARYGAALAKYPIWVANYGVTEPEANGKWPAWVGFQYSDRGRIPGITGYADLDQFTQQVYQGTGPTPTPTPTPIPGSETLYYRTPQDTSADVLAARLGTTAASLRSLNDLVDDHALRGQVVRYPSLTGTSQDAFAGLHLLSARESLSTVARHYGTTAARLRLLNALNTAAVPEGQLLRIPLVPGRTGIAAPPSWIVENVVVLQAGQTMATLAAQHRIPLTTLLEINGLTASDPVYRGQLIHLTPYGKDSVKGFSGGYVVNQGDTLIRIAQRFGTTAQTLFELNNIARSHLIYPGQILLLPPQ